MLGRISDDELEWIAEEINRAIFGNTVAVNPSRNANEAKPEPAVNTDVQAEIKALKKKCSLLRSMYDDLLNKFIEMFGSV